MGTHIIFDQVCSKNLGGKKTKMTFTKEVQVDKDQEKAQSEKRFPLQKPRWQKTKLTIRYLYHENIL